MPADVMRTLSHCLHDYLPFGYFVACSKFSTRLHLPTNASRQPSVVREIQKVVLIMYFLLSLLRWPDVDVELRDCPVFIRRVSPCVAMRRHASFWHLLSEASDCKQCSDPWGAQAASV
jgi:hypothetical protein